VDRYAIEQTLASLPSDTIQLKMVELTKDYYNKNYEKNYEASLNQIKEDAVSTFYQMLQVQEYYKIAKESLAIAENTLELVQKKYKLGSASKLELLSAQVDYQSAVASEASAKNTYETAVMGFNMANSYPLLSELVFEGGDDLVTAPAIELGEAIKLAVANRNEVGQMHFYKEIQDVSWRHTQLTSSNGSVDYLNAKAANMQVSMADRLIEAQIELEIRQRFGDIEAKRLAAQSADKTLELAKEAYNITQISYKLGAATLNELRTASNTLSQAKLGRVAAVSDYNLAVKELEFAVGVGTTAISVGN
ncbi:MAG: TolC family protein, partial [Firmicutes bacterium]|nr:TolC family protein [Bacillota bacterium]